MRHTRPTHQSVGRRVSHRIFTAASWLVVGASLVGLASLNQAVGAVLTFIVAMCSVSSASASETARIKSRFTTVELKSCDRVTSDGKLGPPATSDDTAAWVCKGLTGYPVYIAQTRQRQFISFGVSGRTRRAATQTLGGPIASIFSPTHNRATIEWRFRRQDGRDVPYATIVRVHPSAAHPAKPGMTSTRDVLIVTKVTPTEACQMAQIDARTASDSMILARSAADELSTTFDCKRDEPRIIGNRD
jgi:hypothetical protein